MRLPIPAVFGGLFLPLFTVILALGLGGLGCTRVGPVSATAGSVTQPVLVGQVKHIGGKKEADWGASLGEIDADVSVGSSSTQTHAEGSERVGVDMLKQASMCPKCPIQLDGVYVRGSAGAGSSSVVALEGEVRPASKRGGKP